MVNRTIVASDQRPVELAAGIALRHLQPGGRRGPDDAVLAETMGGQVWSEMFYLGGSDGRPPLLIPDIRLPANQYWPLHWHDCWIAVVIVDGSCLIGDWEMHVGDVLISRDRLEYGPLVIGPSGCQMFEVFARLHPDEGGYAAEFHDHPTLAGSVKFFYERSPLNARNAGRQVLPVDGTDGLSKGRLDDGAEWALGLPDDPERAVLRSTWLAAGETIAPHHYRGWHAIIVMDGSLAIGGRDVGANGILTITPEIKVGEIVAGPNGAKLLEVAYTAAAMARVPSRAAVGEAAHRHLAYSA